MSEEELIDAFGMEDVVAGEGSNGSLAGDEIVKTDYAGGLVETCFGEV